MKRHFMMSLKALCTGVMTLCVASLSFTSCYDDSALNAEVNELGDKVSALDARLQAVEALTAKLEALTARVDALYTLKFQVTAANELQYSFDGGATWVNTGIKLAKELECTCEPAAPAEPCTCDPVEVSLVDNGDSVTITVGDQSFTIEKPEEIKFELRSGKVYFESEGTATVAIKSSGIEDITVMSAPKGWYAEINSDGLVEITAPNYEETQSEMDYETWTEIPAKYAASGYVKIHACSAAGKCMVGKLPVEVVAQPLSVKAYGGKAYFTVATTYSWGPTYFYGACAKEDLQAETAELLKMMSSGGWDHYDLYAYSEETEFVVSVEELLGEEPQLGKEYVVWAVVEDQDKMSFSFEDVVISYYSPLQVTLKEVESEKSAYNVTVNVEVKGADSYVAVALPALYCDDPDYQKEMMATALTEGQYYGKLYTESYTGSALDIAAGTTYSMTGLYSPASDVFVFILPIDGRPVEDYTAADVVMGQYTTAELTSGGSVDLAVKQVTSYMGEVYDYEIWDYVPAEIVLDPYTQLGVEVKLSSSDAWSALYFDWMDDATYKDYAGYDEDLVDYLLENSYGNLPDDVDSWPLYLTDKVAPATTKHFVAFVVDAKGKYGKVAHVELTSEELAMADFTWTEPVETNVVDGTLKNTKTLQITPAFEEGTEAASYKYVLAQTKYYNPYEGMDDAQMAEELFFSTSIDVKTVTAEELVNGVLYVDGHEYGYPYYFAIVPIDANGAPGTSAFILEYETVFAVDNVTTEGHEYDVTEPAVKILLPEEWECYPDGEWGDAAYYGYEYQSYYEKHNFYYEIAYTVNPVEGTEVCSVLVDTESYTLGADAATKAGQVWGGTLGSWNTNTTTEYYESSYRYFNNYEDEPAPALVLCVSWKDAEGNLYYKEYELQEEMQRYADLMKEYIAGTKEIPAKPETPATPALSVAGKQWAFDWADYGMMMGLEHMSSCIDLGVTMPDYFMAGPDYEAIYGPDAAGVWMAMIEGYFEVEPIDETSGNIWLFQSDRITGEMTRSETPITYSNLTETTCTFNCPDYYINNVEATLMTETVTVQSQGIGM